MDKSKHTPIVIDTTEVQDAGRPPIPPSPASYNDPKELNPLEYLQQRLSVWDPNLPDFSAIFGRYSTQEVPRLTEDVKPEVEDSPYREVQAAVRNYDEDVPTSTIRAWVIGITLVFIGASINTIFSLRNPSISISVLLAQLISYGMGKTWALVMPDFQINFFGLRTSLNPGPFNTKEHTLIVVMANVSFGTAYATDIILAQVAFYKQNFGIIFQLLLVITTQIVGYGMAGLLRRFLVWPASMIWPTNLISTTLLYAMHEKPPPPDPNIIGGNMSRYRWFTYVAIASFVWYWFPGFLAQFLSIFAFLTWIKPNNVVVNQLFGGTTGLSLLPITFDWTQVTGFLGSPLASPWHAIANILVGVVVFFLIGAPIFHFSNTWYGSFLPMSDSQTYDNAGALYDVSQIVTPQLTLDLQAYKSYSPLFLSTTFALSYGLSFAAIASLLVHTYLYHRKEIIARIKNMKDDVPDIHMKLMSKYPEVPEWWYLTFFLATTVTGLVMTQVFPTEMAWWVYLLAIVISIIFTLPIGMIQAITNVQIGLNVLTEFIFGYIQPGRPLAMMLFKTYGYITMSQSLSFTSDLKFTHYMKLPPRTVFTAQIVSTLLSCIIQVFVLNLSLTSIPEVCTTTQPQKFTCPGAQVFYSASVIWGLIGPQRIFSPGQIYSGLFYFFALGFCLPLLLFYLSRHFPRSPLKYALAPLILGGSGSIPPATPLNYLSWAVVGLFFNKIIRDRCFDWWKRLNYLTSAGLDLGLALATFVIFFSFTLTGVTAPQWWGNTVVTETMDAMDTAVLRTGKKFGPKSW